MSTNTEASRVGRIGLMSGSFPPLVDGVANTAWNYSRYLEQNHEGSLLFLPKSKLFDLTKSPSPVAVYPALNTVKQISYPCGLPIAPRLVQKTDQFRPSLLHMLDPFMTSVIARELASLYDLPLILTYNTKYDQEIKAVVTNEAICQCVYSFIKSNAMACDEVWVVSRGAAENLHMLGYEGETVLMPNGVDFPREQATEEMICQCCGDLPSKIPVFLFTGRIIREKGILNIISAMSILYTEGIDFRMVFIGDGRDMKELKKAAEKEGLTEKCLFTGMIRDRKVLQAWYTRADLFLFPSEYDTNGLVVTEAAAAGTPSLLIRGSAAAENIRDNVNGFLAKNDPRDLAERILCLLRQPEALIKAGEQASKELYLSWEDAVDLAYTRYQIVLDRCRSGKYQRRKAAGDTLVKAQSKLMAALSGLSKA